MLDKLIPPQFRIYAALAAIAAAFLAGWITNGWRLGEKKAEAEVSALTEAIGTLTERIDGAGKRAEALHGDLNALGKSAAAARKDIANVLPKDDSQCDMPAAARDVLNASSGYPVPDIDAPRP